MGNTHKIKTTGSFDFAPLESISHTVIIFTIINQKTRVKCDAAANALHKQLESSRDFYSYNAKPRNKGKTDKTIHTQNPLNSHRTLPSECLYDNG